MDRAPGMSLLEVQVKGAIKAFNYSNYELIITPSLSVGSFQRQIQLNEGLIY